MRDVYCWSEMLYWWSEMVHVWSQMVKYNLKYMFLWSHKSILLMACHCFIIFYYSLKGKWKALPHCAVQYFCIKKTFINVNQIRLKSCNAMILHWQQYENDCPILPLGVANYIGSAALPQQDIKVNGLIVFFFLPAVIQKRIRTVIEEIVDGKVVSRTVDEDLEDISGQ